MSTSQSQDSIFHLILQLNLTENSLAPSGVADLIKLHRAELYNGYVST